MSNDLLTDDDLRELTGATQYRKQCDILNESGIFYVRRADGKPRTTWFNVNHPAHLRAPVNDEMPDFSAM